MTASAASVSVVEERRRSPRNAPPPRFGVNLLQPTGGVVTVDSLNVSERGLCVRLAEVLEVRSLVRLQLASPEGHAIQGSWPVECTGRVAWVIQRLDLRPEPPFVFDVGLEFVDPPPPLRRWLLQQGLEAVVAKPKGSPPQAVEPVTIRDRQFVPRLTREAARPPRWHLVVLVDDAPCFSARFPSERSALEAWDAFQRQQMKR